MVPMISSRCSLFRVRPAALALFAAGATALVLFSCSSDPPNTLGSEGDLLGSEPGEVIQDTIGVFGDTTYAFYTPIATGAEVEVGIDSLYEHTIILQPRFAGLTQDQLTRTVLSADLRFNFATVPEPMPVRFYRLGYRYAQGDEVRLDLAGAELIVDPETGSAERLLQENDARYPLPPSLVQQWVREDSTREAVAIAYTDTLNELVAFIKAWESSTDTTTLQIQFEGQNERSFRILSDATVYRPRTTTSNLIVSDGFPRRVHLRVELDSLESNVAVHTARLRMHIVPGTLVGTNPVLLIYIPESTDPSTAAFKNGQRIIEQAVRTGDTFVDFKLTNALFLVLQGTLKNNGFAIRFKDENTALRQVELYGTDAPDSLRPRVFVTVSRPAVFE